MKEILEKLKFEILVCHEQEVDPNDADWSKQVGVLITAAEASTIVEALEGKVWIEESAEFKQEDFDKLIPDTPFDSPYQKLFEYMSNEHGVTLLQTDMQEIIHIVNQMEGKQ